MSDATAPGPVRSISFTSGMHRISARFHPAAQPARGAAIVAHPHPAHGGNMEHPVVVTTAERAARVGLGALRFDFRGVGHSEGNRRDFEGHLDDWRQAVREVRARIPDGVLIGGGFSYGARQLAWLLHPQRSARPALDGVLLLAPATRVPTTRRDFGNLLLGRPLSEATLDAHVLENLRSLSGPIEVIVGDEDVVAPHAELAENLPAHAHMQVLPGLNHFFHHGTGAGNGGTTAEHGKGCRGGRPGRHHEGGQGD